MPLSSVGFNVCLEDREEHSPFLFKCISHEKCNYTMNKNRKHIPVIKNKLQCKMSSFHLCNMAFDMRITLNGDPHRWFVSRNLSTVSKTSRYLWLCAFRRKLWQGEHSGHWRTLELNRKGWMIWKPFFFLQNNRGSFSVNLFFWFCSPIYTMSLKHQWFLI